MALKTKNYYMSVKKIWCLKKFLNKGLILASIYLISN